MTEKPSSEETKSPALPRRFREDAYGELEIAGEQTLAERQARSTIKITEVIYWGGITIVVLAFAAGLWGLLTLDETSAKFEFWKSIVTLILGTVLGFVFSKIPKSEA